MAKTKIFTQIEAFPSGMDGFVLNDKGTPKKNSLANAELVFAGQKDVKGIFQYNDLAKKIYVTRNMPWENIPKPRPLTDDDETEATIWLEREAGFSLSINSIHSVISSVAKLYKYNPVVNYLEGLKWDNVERLPLMLTDFLGVENTPYSQAVGKRFMIGAVARAYKPGCKMDNTLVLEGKQGRQQKSTFIEKLFGPDFFGDTIFDIGSKDTSMMVTQKWCFEIPELDALERKNTSEIKAWLTRKVEEFRSPYGRIIQVIPRPCVFIGTTNEENYLKDPTGGRRFWPVLCTEFGHEAMLDVRDQLWAEAVCLYKAGERWWLKESEIDVAEKEQEIRRMIDIWETRIEAHLGQSEETSVEDILQNCICMPAEKWNRAAQMRVAGILQSLNWKKHRTTDKKERKYIYRKYDESRLPFPTPSTLF